MQPKPNSNNNHHNIEASTTVISDDDDDDDDDDSGEHVRGDDSDGGSEGDDMSLFGVQDNSSDEESPMNVAMSSFGLMWTTLESWKTPATIKFLYMKNGLALAPPPPEDECMFSLTPSRDFFSLFINLVMQLLLRINNDSSQTTLKTPCVGKPSVRHYLPSKLHCLT